MLKLILPVLITSEELMAPKTPTSLQANTQEGLMKCQYRAAAGAATLLKLY